MNYFKRYDVFISHAAEDKVLTDEITQSLRQSGLRVWYSSDQLIIGESILGNIVKGLSECRYGVVILSPSALDSPWITVELYNMMERREKDKTIIIPIWHNVDSGQIRQKFPGIANTYALSTNKGLDFVISKLKTEIEAKSRLNTIISLGIWIAINNRRFIFFVLGVFSLIGIGMRISRWMNSQTPPDNIIKQGIRSRIDKANGMVAQYAYSNISLDSIRYLRQSFDGKSPVSDRHSFEFQTGTKVLHSRVSLKRAGIPVNLADVTNAYGFHHFSTCSIDYANEKGNFYFNYSLRNNDSVIYEITDTRHMGEHIYQVTVCYTNFIRAANVLCSYERQTGLRFEKIQYIGLNRKEKFVFEEVDGDWRVTGYNEQ